MKTTVLLGITFCSAGAATLVWHGVTSTHADSVLDVGPLHLSLSPILGVVSILVGVVFLVVGTRK